jgi:hypothetical protein
MRATERIELEALRSLFAIQGATGAIREAAGAAPETSYRNLVRAGFEPAYVGPNYASAGAGSSASSGSVPP